MGTVNRNISRFEVTGVFTHPNARVDIVLVHGLNGQPERTWTAENGVFWPSDLLPESLRDSPANVLVYGYNADVFSRGNGSTASDNFVFQHAQTLVAHLTTYRRSERTSTNPIIWVAHSLGGIVLKRALLYSNDIRAADHEAFRSIYVSTHSIIFLGTPHTGSGLATWGRVLQGMSDAVVPRKLFESESILLKTLKKDNERLQEINSHFLDIYQRFHIHMVHENHKTNLKGTKALVVDADSASPQLPGVTYYGIEATHSGMCKFSSISAPGYRTIATAIQEWVAEAPQIIEKRWAVERKDREDSARQDAEERRMQFLAQSADLGDQDSARQSTNKQPADAAQVTEIVPGPHVIDAGTSPMPFLAPTTPIQIPAETTPTKPEPPFLHPEPFRGNSYFVGRAKELADLHRRLTDPLRRAQGTSAVVIHSLTGGGKTHLARQYVFTHRDDYPGGIYWVRAKSIPEMEQFYWKIAKTEPLRDFVQRSLGRTSPTTPSDENTRRELSNPKHVVDIVRQWFTSIDQWLLVFDGILFNTPGIMRFIPDVKNTSLIYTSIQSRASGRFDFDNPQVLHLGMLSPDEAQELLLTEMEKRKPWLHDDRVRAREIVLLMDCFPLMIHTAAQHLKATHEPLHKYLRAYRTRTPAGDLSAFRAVRIDLKDRGAIPALNLINILSFFDSRIPVGLLHLGLGALDKRTPVLTRDPAHRNRSLNNTFRTLIDFALLERSEAGTIAQTSSQSSSKRSDSLGPDPIDLLLLNSVVQSFFIDVLADSKEAGFWLERAAAVFCRSFNEAERLIKENPKLGLLDDYRCFKNNGEKLLEHLNYILGSKKPDPQSDALADAKDGVTSRLVLCASSIERLSEASQKYITTEMDLSNPTQEDASMVSVFEHASSASDWEDSTTPSSQTSGDNSVLSSRTGTGLSGIPGSGRPASANPDSKLTKTTAAMNMDLGMGTGQNSRMSNGKDKAPLSQLAIDRALGRLVDTDAPLHMSPEHLYAPFVPDGDNPYHWHVPYPPARNYIPAPPIPGDTVVDESDGQDDGAVTVVPTPRVPAADTGWNPPAFHLRYSTLPADGMSSSNRPSVLPPTAHRTVRKSHNRRYHDTAGAWRDSAVRDPRTRMAHISVSRESAKGFVYMSHQPSSATSSPGRGHISAGSEAEMALNKIRATETARVAAKEAPEVSAGGPPQRPAYGRLDTLSMLDTGDLADDEWTPRNANRGKGRSQSAGTMGVRPPLSLRREDAAGRSHLNEVFIDGNNASHSFVFPPGSQAVKRAPESPPSAWSILKRLKENIPSWLVTGRSQEQTHQQQQQQRRQGPLREPARAENLPVSAMPGAWQSYADDEQAFSRSANSLLGAGTGPFGRGSRTSRSSPANSHGPFTPPQPLHHTFHHYAAVPLYYQTDNPSNRLARLRSAQTNGASGTAANSWMEEVYHTANERLSDTDLGFGFVPGRNGTDMPFAPYPAWTAYTHRQPPSVSELLAGRVAEQTLLQPAPPAKGYTSEPMSRDTSTQSQAERLAAAGSETLPDSLAWRGLAARRRAGVGSALLDDYYDDDDDAEESGLSQSLPAQTGFYRGGLDGKNNRRNSIRGNGGSSAAQAATPRPIIPHLRRMSRSSLVETEPSPRTDDPFPDVHTSYQLWEERNTYGGGGGSVGGADSDRAAGYGGYTHRVRAQTASHSMSGEWPSSSMTLPVRPLAEDFNAAVGGAEGGGAGSLEGGDARVRRRAGSGRRGGTAGTATRRESVPRVGTVPRSYSDSGLMAAGSQLPPWNKNAGDEYEDENRNGNGTDGPERRVLGDIDSTADYTG